MLAGVRQARGPRRLALTARPAAPGYIPMLKTLIIATMLLPKLAIAQQFQQLTQPRHPGQWCPVGWMASGSYCVPGSDKAPAAMPKEGLVSDWLARERQLLRAEPQTRLYDSQGRGVGTSTPYGSVRYYDARGKTLGTSTTTGNTTRFYDAGGRPTGSSTSPGSLAFPRR
jgi:YD repeat-containing protein